MASDVSQQSVLEEALRHSRQPWSRADVWLLVAVVIATMVYAGVIHASLDPRFFSDPIGNDVWFEADMPVVADRMVHRWADQSRNANHPLFPLATTLPAYGLGAFGLTPAQRVLGLVTLAGGLWGAMVFLLLRLATRTRADAVVFTLLTCATAAAMFWLPTAETYVLGSATLLAPLTLLAWDSRSQRADRWYVAASAVSLSVTISNWMSGVAAALSGRPVRAAVQITANALVIVVMLWAMQKVFAPSEPFFIGSGRGARFFWSEMAGGPVAITRSLVFHSVVMPEVEVVPEPKWGPRMSVQGSALGSSGALGRVAALLWAALLTTGIVALVVSEENRALRLGLLLTVAGQLALYTSYGEESFLYALHMAPLLVACAAFGTFTVYRRWVLLAAAVLTVLLITNNSAALAHAREFFSWGGRPGAL